MSKPDRMTTTGLEEAIAAEAQLSAAQAARAVAAFRDIVTREVAAGRSVALTNFGTWLPYEWPARKMRNPQTGAAIAAPGFRSMKWRTSPRAADIVRAHDTTATTRKRSSRPQKPADTAGQPQDA
jgi:DNA-binding protein HU-beta